MKSPWLLCALALIGAAIAANAASSVRRDLRRLRAQVDALSSERERECGERRTDVMHAMAALAGATAKQGDRDTARRLVPEPAIERPADVEVPRNEPPPPISDEAQFRHLESEYRSQAGGSTWSVESETRLRGAFRRLVARGSEVRELACRSTLCRAQISLENQGQLDALVQTLMTTSPLWEGSSAATTSEPDSDGRVTLTLYYAKPEATLPLP